MRSNGKRRPLVMGGAEKFDQPHGSIDFLNNQVHGRLQAGLVHDRLQAGLRAHLVGESGLGVRAGVSDLLLWRAGESYALPLKALGGRQSEAQIEFLVDMQRAGAFACLAEDLDRALAVLEAWGLLRGRVAP